MVWFYTVIGAVAGGIFASWLSEHIRYRLRRTAEDKAFKATSAVKRRRAELRAELSAGKSEREVLNFLMVECKAIHEDEQGKPRIITPAQAERFDDLMSICEDIIRELTELNLHG